MSKLNWVTKACGVLLLWAMAAVALPGQTFTTLLNLTAPMATPRTVRWSRAPTGIFTEQRRWAEPAPAPGQGYGFQNHPGWRTDHALQFLPQLSFLPWMATRPGRAKPRAPMGLLRNNV